jgi:hypothetical protein
MISRARIVVLLPIVFAAIFLATGPALSKKPNSVFIGLSFNRYYQYHAYVVDGSRPLTGPLYDLKVKRMPDPWIDYIRMLLAKYPADKDLHNIQNVNPYWEGEEIRVYVSLTFEGDKNFKLVGRKKWIEGVRLVVNDVTAGMVAATIDVAGTSVREVSKCSKSYNNISDCQPAKKTMKPIVDKVVSYPAIDLTKHIKDLKFGHLPRTRCHGLRGEEKFSDYQRVADRLAPFWACPYWRKGKSGTKSRRKLERSER